MSPSFKKITKILAIFIFGIAGGIFADQILCPYFIERPLFYKYRLEQAPTYVTKIENITIQENTALQEAVEKNKKTIIGIRTKLKTGQVLEGSGVAITSDGLIITLAELVPQGENFVFFVDNETPSYQVLKRDSKNNLALIKLEGKNLPTIGFADYEKIGLGERVFLISAKLENNTLNKTINEGIIKSISDSLIYTNIFDVKNCAGSPLFNMKGELVGLNFLDATGSIKSIPAKTIKEFSGL